MGDEQYTEKYVEFGDLLEKLRRYQKDGKAKLKTSLQQQEDDLLKTTLEAKNTIAASQAEERKEANVRVRDTISVEEQVFREKLKVEIEEFDSDDIVSIEK